MVQTDTYAWPMNSVWLEIVSILGDFERTVRFDSTGVINEFYYLSELRTRTGFNFKYPEFQGRMFRHLNRVVERESGSDVC